MTPGLIDELAEQYNLEPALIEAVALVESGGGTGFRKTGLLAVLFEAHLFYAQLKRKWVTSAKTPVAKQAGMLKLAATMAEHPDLISVKSNPKLYLYGDAENKRLARALKIDPVAAWCASYGMFQILGMHFSRLGFETVDEYIEYLNAGQDNHVRCFIKFITTDPGLLVKLRNHDWDGFAYTYNGASYAKAGYQNKLKTAYIKALAARIKA